MEILRDLYETVRPGVPFAVTLAVVSVVIASVYRLLDRRARGSSEFQYKRQIVMLALSLAGLMIVVMALPISEGLRGQLVGLIGIVISAALALSSTTFMGNFLAGLMLRAVRNFRPGDFVTVEGHFGRVSDRGLFHTEIQTEDRDLVTLPNLYLVTNPVRVIRSSGTLVSATVSLGYDIPRAQIEERLVEAGRETGLGDPFVSILELGDFSVTYRIAGILTEVKGLITTRSRLRAQMLDHLHKGGIEIVSPAFLNRREVGSDRRFVPPSDTLAAPTARGASTVEAIVFDKADDAESLEKLRHLREAMLKKIDELEERMADAHRDDRPAVEKTIERQRVALERLEEAIRRRESEEK